MRMRSVMAGSKPSAVTAGGGPVIVWFRLDLRLADNPALSAAAKTAGRAGIIPVFIWAPDEEAPFAPGAASRVWLHDSLSALAAALVERGSRLVLRVGPTQETLLELAGQTGARGVFWNRRYEPAVAARDARVDATLRARHLATATELGLPSANLLWEPEALTTKTGQPFRMFTPFWRASREQPPPEPLPAPRELPPPPRWPTSAPLAALGLRPKIGWDAGLRAAWSPGEASARTSLKRFVAHGCGAIPRRAQSSRPRRQLASVAASAFRRDRPACRSGAPSSARPSAAAIDPLTVPARARLARVRLSPAAPLPDARPRRRCAPSSRAFPGRRRAAALRPGSAARPAIRWSTPACASSGRPAGCTTACGWSSASFLVKHLLRALAGRGALVLGHAGRRRSGQQHAGLAVDRRLRRRRRAVLPHLQSGDPGPSVRSRRRLRAPLGARAGQAARADSSTPPGWRPPRCWPARASRSGERIRGPSSITPGRARGRWPPSTEIVSATKRKRMP